ncbi:MAG: aminotransferase class V-fold PLP-dependent enzyme [Bacteroidota bacterium]
MEIIQDIQNHFRGLATVRYVNTATSGLLSNTVLAWRKDHDLDYATHGSEKKVQTEQILSQLRETLGDCFGCHPQNIALVPSFSVGVNLLLEGLGPSEKVVLLEQEYPSLNWAFQNRGFTIDMLPITGNLEEIVYNHIRRSGATVLACSMVQWLNGIQLGVDFFKQLKRDFPALLIVVDGTQYCGVAEFDFLASGIDIFGTSGYKWLLAGYGNGFFLVRESAKERFSLKAMGYGSGRNVKENRMERTFCKHLETGHLDSLSFGSLYHSLHFLKTIGFKGIGDHNTAISKAAKTIFTDLGILEDRVKQRKNHSSIFNIQIDSAMHKRLLENGIVCARRGGGTRLSFHFYNTPADLEAIITVLKA